VYCFTEIYRIYANDKELEDPVYTKNLEVHFAFVKEHWSSLEFSYRKIAAQYEDEWARRWRGHGTSGEVAEQPESPEPPPSAPRMKYPGCAEVEDGCRTLP